jgi:hypothetical protein
MPHNAKVCVAAEASAVALLPQRDVCIITSSALLAPGSLPAAALRRRRLLRLRVALRQQRLRQQLHVQQVEGAALAPDACKEAPGTMATGSPAPEDDV